ncbi:MAG: hypothetical protein Q8R96_18865 [Bacteroidota bacterium]|nr:hypothetical protein [Bacteroidota bacterium]
MRNFAIVLITFLYLFGCKNDDQPSPIPKLQNCAIEYLYFSDDYRFAGNTINFPPNDALKTICSYEYQNDKIVKVTGGFLRVPSGSNFSNFVFSEDVSDSIVYSGNNIYVFTKYTNLPSSNSGNPITYTLDSDDKIQKLTLSNGFDTSFEVNYSYSKNEITEKNKNGVIFRKFYMEGNNLVRIVKQSFDLQGNIIRKEEILFQEYDTNPNPFKNKYHILGAFYRAFSKNNYKKTTKLVYTILVDGSFGLISTSQFSMPIIYDDRGYPLFGTYE